MLALGKNIVAGDRFLHGNNGWGNRAHLWGVEITGKTLGLVGMGQIGTLVAKRCRSAFHLSSAPDIRSHNVGFRLCLDL